MLYLIYTIEKEKNEKRRSYQHRQKKKKKENTPKKKNYFFATANSNAIPFPALSPTNVQVAYITLQFIVRSDIISNYQLKKESTTFR